MCLQHHNAKGFISAWHNHRITGFEERLVQGSTHGQSSDMTQWLQIRECPFLTENVNFHHFLPKRSFTHETLIFFSQLPQQPFQMRITFKCVVPLLTSESPAEQNQLNKSTPCFCCRDFPIFPIQYIGDTPAEPAKCTAWLTPNLGSPKEKLDALKKYWLKIFNSNFKKHMMI